MAFPLQFPWPNSHQASLKGGGQVGHILNLQVPSNTCPLPQSLLHEER